MEVDGGGRAPSAGAVHHAGAPLPDPAGATFAVEQEDHSLANALRFFLNKDPRVSFAGYSMPHPTEDVVNVRVQTTGQISATEALQSACTEVQRVCDHVLAVFDRAVDEHKVAEGAAAGGAAGGNDGEPAAAPASGHKRPPSSSKKR